MQQVLNSLTAVLIATGLVACSVEQDRKVKYMQQGKQLLQAGDFKEAQLAFENALHIDADDNESRYQMAEALSKQGEISKAFENYQLVAKHDDKHLMARIRVGQLLLLNGQLDDAENIMNQAITLQPDDIEALLFKANVNVARNNTDAAIVSVEKALRIDKHSASAIMMMASIDAKTGKTDKAIHSLQQGLVSSADNESMHLMLANLLVKNQLNNEAEKELKVLIKLKPKSFSAYQHLAAFYIATERLDDAESILRDAIIHSKESLNAKLYLIDFLTEKRNVDVAMVELLPMIDKAAKVYPLQFKLVSLQLNKGDIESAEATLKDIIEFDKLGDDGIKARNTLAGVYMSSQRIEQARELVSAVLTKQPKDIEALILRGQFALADKEMSTAITDFRTVLADQPNHVQALKLLASTHVANNDLVLAAENMQKVVAILPADNGARQDLVELLIRSGDHQQAEQHVAVLLKQNASSKKTLESLFKIRLIQKNWEAAQQITQLFLHDLKDEPTGFYMSGLAYQAEGKLQASIDAFKKALEIKPDAIEPLTQLIKSYIALDQSKNAISFLKKLIKTGPDHFIAYNLLGDLYFQNDKLDDADKAFRQAIKIKPEWAVNYRNIAKLALLNKNQSAAIKILQKGIDKTGMAMELVADLATIYHGRSEPEEVVKLFERAYKKQPNSAVAINNLASYLIAIDDSKENLTRAEQLAAPLEQTGNPMMMDTVAWIAFKQGSYDKAQKILEKVIGLGAVPPVISYHLGMVYYKQGDNSLARNYLDKAVSASTDFEGKDQVRKILQTIKNS